MAEQCGRLNDMVNMSPTILVRQTGRNEEGDVTLAVIKSYLI